MNLKTKLQELQQRVNSVIDQINTEEATKTALVLPFIQMLGYDVFNPTEVIPEYTADIGTKKGEKVDYVITKEKSPIIIIECKHWKEDLNAHNSQLHRYYPTTPARFAIITNGIIYNFFTDLEAKNVMDNKPFLVIDLNNLRDSSIRELGKFSKELFTLENILNSAEELKYINEIKKEFEKELINPSDELTKLLVARFFDRPITASRLISFKNYTKSAITSSINETINARLKNALSISETSAKEEENNIEVESRVFTTDEELDGFQIIKAILREVIPAERIAYRDTQSYLGVATR